MDGSGLNIDELLETAPEGPAVFAIFASEGAPYLARTSQLRRRLKRLLGPNARLFSLRNVAQRVEFAEVASRLEAALTHYHWAKRHFGADWRKRLRLRYPSFVKVILSNEFPRTQVTSRLSGSAAFYGPFQSRAGAEAFESQLLDLYQIRRCSEDLEPASTHPGCIYGEMNLCLRPCQKAVSPAEYASEVTRLRSFLETDGGALRASITTARDRASDMLEFEEAQRQQKRLEKLEQVIRMRDDLAHDLESLSGVAILPAASKGAVKLWPFQSGWWQQPLDFPLEGAGMSMDSRLRELFTSQQTERRTMDERQEHTAMLAHWFHSSFRDGEWLPQPLSYRRLVRAINLVSQSPSTPSNPPAAT